jgi:hypothetical protein
VPVGLRKRERDHEPERAGTHRGEIAERGGGGAISYLEVVEPVAAEMDALEGGVGADDELFTSGDLENRGVVSDTLGRLAPFGQQRADDVEFLSRSEGDVAAARAVVRFAHRATAGRVAITGGS